MSQNNILYGNYKLERTNISIIIIKIYLKKKKTYRTCLNAFSYYVELETMKERFSKLLLGEDMSGSGKGVCTAVSISNAITNLYGISIAFSPRDFHFHVLVNFGFSLISHASYTVC